MQIHDYLHRLRFFERRHLSFIDTMDDLDIVISIGLYQEQGLPLTMKQMLSFNICSSATLERRLARLKREGVIIQSRSQYDKRNVELKLSPKTNRIFQRYATLVETSNVTVKGH